MKYRTAALASWLKRPRQALRRWALPALLGVISASALAAAPRDRLTLLVPDGADPTSWQVKVWIDSAAEEGITLDLITDSALLTLGAQGAASKIAGLIVPDSAHMVASGAVVQAIKDYAYLGGKLMLVYDAGVLTESGTYPISGNSRFSDIVGVQYVLYNDFYNHLIPDLVGFGPVQGTRARLDTLSLPPGKFVPATLLPSLASTTYTTAFVPTSARDPGGTEAMKDLLKKRAQQAIEDGSANLRNRRRQSFRELLGIGVEGGAQLRYDRRFANASKARDKHIYDQPARAVEAVDAVLNADGSSSTERSFAANTGSDLTLQFISGYSYAPTNYYHFLTSGDVPSDVTVLLSSPEHGLVASQRAWGSGRLLFVNIPLGAFKAHGTDSAPLHGFLGLFARDQVGISTVSVQPAGRGGLIYNWHIDDGDDLTVNTKYLLDKTKVLQRGPFSIHLTAGPDVISFGDGNGMDLNNNKKSQELLLELAGQKKDGKDDKKSKLPDHAIGSHGGWIHDYWGVQLDKDLQAGAKKIQFGEDLLRWNFEAIENVTRRPIREYSSPVGYTPDWAVKWLEQRGVVAMYLVGDGGAGMVRSWRNDARLTDKLWTSPVTPLGKYATFEEFDEFGISDSVSGQWLLDLQSFAVNHRTNRMFYNHPPGAAAHLKPITALLNRADDLQAAGRFNWYTMTQLADFSQRRIETQWSTSTQLGVTTFSASHATSLADVTRLLPKASFTMPVVVAGKGTVSQDAGNWIVTAEAGTVLRFITVAR